MEVFALTQKHHTICAAVSPRAPAPDIASAAVILHGEKTTLRSEEYNSFNNASANGSARSEPAHKTHNTIQQNFIMPVV